MASFIWVNLASFIHFFIWVCPPPLWCGGWTLPWGSASLVASFSMPGEWNSLPSVMPMQATNWTCTYMDSNWNMTVFQSTSLSLSTDTYKEHFTKSFKKLSSRANIVFPSIKAGWIQTPVHCVHCVTQLVSSVHQCGPSQSTPTSPTPSSTPPCDW